MEKCIKLEEEEFIPPLIPPENNNHLPNNESQPECKKKRVGYLGILLALLASFLAPIAGLIVKYLNKEGYHPFSLSFWRFQGVLLPAIPMAFYYRKSITIPTSKSTLLLILTNNLVIFVCWLYLCPPDKQTKHSNKVSLQLRGLAGCSAVVFQFYSLQFITLADSSVISFSTPVFVSLLGHFTLKERCGFVPTLAGILALIGVIIISRPPLLTGQKSWDLDSLWGTLLALGCMTCATMTFILLRHLRTLHYAMLNLFFGIWGSLETAGLSLCIWKFQGPQGSTHWALGIALAVISFVTQLCMTLAFKFEMAATISLVRSCDVIFVFLWQWAVFQLLPDLFSIVGATVVMTGIVLVGFRKWISQLPPQDIRRKRFCCFLI